VLPVIEIMIFRHLNRRWKESGKFGEKRTIVSVLLCAVTIFLTVNLLIATDYRKSKVDVSPMAELSVEQVYMLEDVIKRLEEHDYVSRFSIGEGQNGRTYRFYWQNPKSGWGASPDVNISFADDEYAANRIKYGKKDAGVGRYRLVCNDNDTEALLFHARLYRNEYFSGASWSQRSYFRFGNALIIIWEGLDSKGSSEFIEWLCELLADTSP